MSKWREPTRRVLEKLEDILGTYESFICGRASASNARHTFDDELVPWTEPKKRRGSSPDYAAVYEAQHHVRELLTALDQPELSEIVKETLEKDLRSSLKKLQRARMRFIGKMEASMVSCSKNNWTEDPTDRKNSRTMAVKNHPLKEDPEEEMTVKELWEIWYDGRNSKYNKILAEHGDDVSRYPCTDLERIPAKAASDDQIELLRIFDFARTRSVNQKAQSAPRGPYKGKLKLEQQVDIPGLEKYDIVLDSGSQWLYENYYRPFILQESESRIHKLHPVPPEIVRHRNMVLEILREIEDYMDKEIRRDLTNQESGERTRKNAYLPDTPTPYHMISKNLTPPSAQDRDQLKQRLGFDYEKRGWRDIDAARQRKTSPKKG
jgi:hypothetical protein